MIKLKLHELHEGDNAGTKFCNGGFMIVNDRYGDETIQCDLTIQEIYALYKEIEKLKAFAPYHLRMLELTK